MNLITNKNMGHLLIKTESELPYIAKQLLPAIREHQIIAFYGEMGAGKTTLIKEICNQMGVQDYVTSPTFSIVNIYIAQSQEEIYHFDFYRIESLKEAVDIGLDEYFDSGNICLMEWPEKIESYLPKEVLKIHIKVNPDESREVEF